MENKEYTLNRVRKCGGIIYVARSTDENYSGEIIEENIKSDIFVIVRDTVLDELSSIMAYDDYQDEVHLCGNFRHPSHVEYQFGTFEEAREYEKQFYEKKEL